MPAPDAFKAGLLGSAEKSEHNEIVPPDGILFVTDRRPATSRDKEKFYRNVRGTSLRVGVGSIAENGSGFRAWIGNKTDSTESFRGRNELTVDSIDEFGYLTNALPYGALTDPLTLTNAEPADEAFADLINQTLAASERKEIVIYVHGVMSVFEKPLLVAAEFWRFLGHDGVFVAYAWPSTPRRFAYFRDVETTRLAGRNLRLFLEYLAEKVDADRIHIIGFSAGTRLVMTALHELALKRNGNVESITPKIGTISLFASDYDRDRFGAAIADGALEIPTNIAIYLSEKDRALSLSKFFLRETRLGQLIRAERTSEPVKEWLTASDHVNFIDVTDAEKSGVRQGHAYFRESPWASSDLLLSLKYGLAPSERGLKREGEFGWRFPPDYVERLQNEVREAVRGLR